MVSLAYQLVPGVTAAEAAAGADSDFVVDATYETDVDLPWTTGGPGFGPGSIEEYVGGASTGGASGPWPLPGNATSLRFSLYAAGSQSAGAPHRFAGTLEVDLPGGTARWNPAR